MGLANREKFNPTSYNDVAFAGAFLVHIVGLIGWVVFAASTGKYAMTHPQTALMLWQGESARAVAASQSGTAIATLTFASVFVAAAWGAVWLYLLQTYPTEMVKVAVWFFPIMMTIVGVVLLLSGLALHGAIFIVIACFLMWAISRMGDRIEFTGKLFKGVSVIYSSSKGIFVTAIAVVLVQGAFMILWLLALIPILIASQASKHDEGSAPSPLAWFGMLLSLYWGAQVFSNILSVSSGGVVARWYFNQQTDTAAQTATNHACTYYFGSICFGSLLIAIVQTLKAMAESARDNADEEGNTVGVILAYIAICLLGCLESIAKCFNTFAFALISIYGLPFVEAGKEVFDLMERAGISAVVNYSMVGMVSTFGTLAGAVLVGGMNALSAWRLGLAAGYILGAGFLGFLVGLSVMSVVGRLLEAGTTTLFVCYAEEPDKLQSSRKELYDAFNECKALKF
jgi:hypothetical protein